MVCILSQLQVTYDIWIYCKKTNRSKLESTDCGALVQLKTQISRGQNIAILIDWLSGMGEISHPTPLCMQITQLVKVGVAAVSACSNIYKDLLWNLKISGK